MIPYGRHKLDEHDIKSVIDVLLSDFLTQGDTVPRFENEMTTLCNVKFATAVNSATSALHIACLALGVTSDDVVWTVPNTFVASANCALYCGAKIDFVDIDPSTLNMSVEALVNKLHWAKKHNALPKVIIVVHLGGEPCDLEKIYDLSNQFGFRIIEDASHAIGAKYKESFVGSCKYSDVTVLSFHPVKIITSAEGGMALTNDPKLDRKMKLLRTHGITRDRMEMLQCDVGPWYYEQIELGYNYRMSDIHAALGMSQMRHIKKFLDARLKIANKYDKAFNGTEIIPQYRDHNNVSSLHLYIIQVPHQKHRRIFNYLRRSNIGVNLHYIPVHLHPYYQRMGFRRGAFPNSEKCYVQSISLPIYPDLTDEQQCFVIEKVTSATSL